MPKLAELAPTQKARITRTLGDTQLTQRLLELGFVEGVPVEVIRRAPLGDPVEYSLEGFRIALRRSEANCVEVEPL